MNQTDEDLLMATRPDNNGRKVSVGYLLREGFANGRRGVNSGWEYHNPMSRQYSPIGHVYDITNDQNTAIFKKFLRQSSTCFTVDLRLEASGKNQGSQIAIKSGGLYTLLMEINGDDLFYLNHGKPHTQVATLPTDEMTGLRMEINLKALTSTIWINGRIKLKDVPLYAEVSTADTIYFGSITEGCSDYILRGLEIYKGFALHENLYNAFQSNIPDNWTCKWIGSDQSICESYDYSKMVHGVQFTVFKLVCGEPNDSVQLKSSYSISGSGIYEFDYYFEQSTNGFEVNYTGKSGSMKFFTKDGDLCFLSEASDHEVVLISGVKTRVWYRIQLLLDSEHKTLMINTNGYEAYTTALSGRLTTGDFSSIQISALPGSSGDVLIDRIYIKPMIAYRLVPAPNIADTGDVIVNLQVCNLWREGTHRGWSVYPGKYENRKPILGWYDEGDPEVADWEVKWALEHGIKSFMYCWYRPHSGPIPIKQGYLDEQLWDGYFNSRFKKDFNFTVMFTNHNIFNIESADDMVDNVMPYMIEVFFKNPNYLKTADNKPILYIYQLDELMKKLGDPNVEGSQGTTADVKAMFDRMREATKREGFAGLIILGEYRGKDPNFIRMMSESGYDYSFAYTWHPEAKYMSNDAMLAQIKDYLTTQRKLYKEYGDTTKVIPNVSVAWDPTAWNLDANMDPRTTFTFDLEHLEALLKWSKDDFGTPTFEDGKTRMIMIDNWNEYGEGHYFMPAYGTPAYDLDEDGKPCAKKGKAGFGWLDCIRRIYGQGEFEHEDLWPLQAGYGPYDKFFPPAWEENHVPKLD